MAPPAICRNWRVLEHVLLAQPQGLVGTAVHGGLVAEARRLDAHVLARGERIAREELAQLRRKARTVRYATPYELKTKLIRYGLSLGYDYEAFKKGTEAIQELKNGKCDVVVLDSATANQYVEEAGGIKIVEDDEAFSSEQYGIAVKSDDAELLEKVNASIEKFKEDGTIEEISMKYSESEA